MFFPIYDRFRDDLYVKYEYFNLVWTIRKVPRKKYSSVKNSMVNWELQFPTKPAIVMVSYSRFVKGYKSY